MDFTDAYITDARILSYVWIDRAHFHRHCEILVFPTQVNGQNFRNTVFVHHKIA